MRRSHRAEPIPITQLSPAAGLRKPTARISEGRSAQKSRNLSSAASSRFSVSVRKMALAVSEPSVGWLAMGVIVIPLLATVRISPF